MTTTWEAGNTASIMVDGKRRRVLITEIRETKAKVRRDNGIESKVYLNALLAPGQTVHFRAPKANFDSVASTCNALAADGYAVQRIVNDPEGTNSIRVLASKAVPEADEPEGDLQHVPG
jgi:hypothetical protein